jgi:hypothetical protein
VCVCFSLFFLTCRRLRFLARGTRSGAARGHGSSLRHHFAFEVNGQIVKETKQTQKTLSRLKQIHRPHPHHLQKKTEEEMQTHSDLFIKQQQIGSSPATAQFVDPVI